MIVKAIARDKKHLTRIFLSDDSEFLLDNDILGESSVSVGCSITEEEISQLKYSSDYKRAKNRALWYLDRMDYTEKALFEKLVKAGFSKKASAAVMARLCELGVVDDRRYAERMAEKCMESNISKREAMHKMLMRGVPYELAKEMLENSEADEEQQIINLLEGKYAYKLTLENGAEKVYAALVRKGFSYSAVRNAIKSYAEQIEFCEEW